MAQGNSSLQIWSIFVEWLLKPVRGLQFVRNLLKEGGHTIETSFTYRQRPFLLRTVIGFGDIINFIPNPEGYYHNHAWHDLSTDAEWYNCYQTHLQTHFDKIQRFLNAVNRQTDFWERSINRLAGAANIYPMYQAIVMKEWLLLLIPLLSGVYLYFFGKATAQKIVQLLWRVANWLFAATKQAKLQKR